MRRADQLASTVQGLLKPLLVIGVAALLLLLEPDFGASVVLAATTFGVLFIAGARLRDFLCSRRSSAASRSARSRSARPIA